MQLRLTWFNPGEVYMDLGTKEVVKVEDGKEVWRGSPQDAEETLRTKL